jgi:hypothetical protein
MALDIETFSNATGGNAAYKALSHPAAAGRGRALAARLAGARRVAVYDPHGLAAGFAALFDLSKARLAGTYVQDIAAIGREVLGVRALPVTDLAGSGADLVFAAAFDAERAARHIAHLVPKGADIVTLDAMRLADEVLTRPDRYLDPLNFATNFAFFRDADGRHTRLATANYWTRYGATDGFLWCQLFDGDGAPLAEWRETLDAPDGAIAIDSRDVRARFGLGDFTGQLFVHRVGAAGHDVVKYALDTWSDGGEISCTHDANAWPADRYAGLPAPHDGERVVVWLQNSHPSPIPAGAVGLNVMGSDDVAWLGSEVAPFATVALDTRDLLPDVEWPGQIELRCGRHMVRPRYEVVRPGGARRIAHVNVERADLKPDPKIAELGNLLGKGFILPAPVLPPDTWESVALPTPMATTQAELPVACALIDASGREVARHRFGRLARGHRAMLSADALIATGGLPSGYGHMELLYDFTDGGEADGWLHGLFRYTDRRTGDAAETSFGAHVFNTVLTWKSEPQSYSGRPPGLTTRLYLRLGAAPNETLCHLIYAASTPWRATSDTTLILHAADGSEIATRQIEIPCGGSVLWRYTETFDAATRAKAGDDAYVVVRDPTCRLFGYHGLIGPNGAFSLDHMFGY